MKRITTLEQAKSHAATGKAVLAKQKNNPALQKYLNKFQSPKGYEAWNDHVTMAYVQAEGVLRDPNLLNSIKTKNIKVDRPITEEITARASDGMSILIAYMATTINAPARYISKSLCESFVNTTLPKLTEPPPLALPAFRLFLPQGLLRSEVGFPIDVLIIVDRLNVTSMLLEAGHTDYPSADKPGFLCLAILQTGESYFYDYIWGDPLAKGLNQDSTVQATMEQAATIAAQAILVMAYEPELIVIDDPRTVTAGKGFGCAEPTDTPAPATWIGKNFHRHVVQPVIRKGQSVPTGRTVKPHWRQGHYRCVWTGKGRSKPKLVWIRPVYVATSLE